MTPAPEALQGMQMTESEMDEFLLDQGVGVLSLASDDTPYGIPLSFGYDGSGRLYFVFVGHSEEWKKVTFAEESTEASFLAHEVVSGSEWRSVIVTGSFDRITPGEWTDAREAMGENAFRPDLLTDVDPNETPNVWVLEAEEKTGRAVGHR